MRVSSTPLTTQPSKGSFGCGYGYHRNNWRLGKCFPDFDYRVVNVHHRPDEMAKQLAGARPIRTAKCQTGTYQIIQHSESTLRDENSAATSPELTAEPAFSLSVIAEQMKAHLPGGVITTRLGMMTDGSDCPAGSAVRAYPVYNIYRYDIAKIDTRSGRTVKVFRGYRYYDQIGGGTIQVENH